MQFFKLLALVSSLAVANAVQFTNTATELTGIAAGKPLTIKWSGASGAVTINLKSGPSTAQTFVEAITTGATGTSFTWTPESTLPDATYNLEIKDSTGVPNYSVQFEITGGTGNPSTLGSSVTSVASSTSGSVSSAASTTPSSSASSTSGSSSSSTPSSTSVSKTTASSTTSGSSTSSTASVPTSNSAVQNGSPFALVMLGALAIAGMN